MMTDHTPIPIKRFRGLFDRGRDDAVPSDFAIECQNCTFKDAKGVETRPGSQESISIGQVRRIWTYKRPGEVSRLLILSSAGELYDSTNIAVPILTVSGMLDFSAVSYAGRAYISPHNGFEGLPGQFIYVYNGSGQARQTGGSSPLSGPVVTTSLSSGFVEAGFHLVSVAFETASGYITIPGPVTGYNAPGGFQMTVANIPIGGVGVVARRILVSKIVTNYNGDPTSVEMFFVPGGRIPDNVTTTITLNFFDAHLVSSADYLLDQRVTNPACLHLNIYKDMMIAANYDGGNNTVLISKPFEVESFDSLTGFKDIDPSESSGVKTTIEFRSSLIIFKSLTAYQTTATENPPSTWPLDTIDRGAGTEVFGVSQILDKKGANTDKFLIADKSGLMIFDGSAVQPELTFAIRDVWDRINENAASKVQVFNDTTHRSLYVALPLDANVFPNVILYGDYSEGLSLDGIKWSLWVFPWTNLCITVDVTNDTQIPFLRIGSFAGNIYDINESLTNDDGIGIDSFYETYLIASDPEGFVNHFGGIRYRVVGSGLLETRLSSLDGTVIKNLVPITLSVTPNKYYFKNPNFKSEKVSVRIRTFLFGEYWKLNELIIYMKPLWADRPR